MPGPAATPTPVGRDHELRSAIDAVVNGCGMLITGVPGVGKTHLARRVVDQLQRTTTVASVRFTSAADPNGLDGNTTRHGEGPGTHVIVLEDTHLLAADGLDHLLADCRNGRLCLIATGHRVTGTPARLVRDGVLVHLRLAPLDHGDIAQLVRERLGGPVAADVIRYVWQTSAGNPRYAIDLVESAVEEGRLVFDDGTWLLTGGPTAGSRILAQVESDLAGHPPAERDVIDLVALGGPVPLDTLLAAVDDTDAFDGLIRDDQLVMDTDEATGAALVRSAHPRFGDLTALLVPPARRRELFTRMFPSNVLPEHPDEHLVHCARWGLSAAVPLSARGLLGAARAAAASGWLDATDQLTTAALAAFGPRAPERVEALLLRSETLRTAGRTAEAVIVAEAARTEVDTVDLPDATRREWSRLATVARADLAQFGAGDTGFALELIDAEAARLGTADDPGDPTATRLAADRSMRLAYGARFDEAGAVTLPAAAVADLPAGLRIDREIALVYARAFRGGLCDARDRALHLVDESLAFVDDAPWGPLQAQSALFVLLLWTGEPDVAMSLVDSVDTDPDAPGFVDPAIRQLGWGRAAMARSDWDQAVTELEAAVARFRVVDFSGWSAVAHTWLSAARAAAGDPVGAARALAVARETPLRASGILLFDLWDHWWRIGLALGSPDAVGRARRLIDEGRDRRLALVELWGWHALACCAVEPVDTARARRRIDELAERVQGPLAATRADHARALVAGDGAVSAAAFARLTELGHWMPVNHVPAAATLTSRQLEVARLAASGLSSTAIAERLHISKRTVESHLGNVYLRLGVGNRAGLTAVLAGAADPP